MTLMSYTISHGVRRAFCLTALQGVVQPSPSITAKLLIQNTEFHGRLAEWRFWFAQTRLSGT